MNSKIVLTAEQAAEMRERCLCSHVQRAARRLARHYDDALRPVGLTHGQFSLLIALVEPKAPSVKRLAETLGMDRTSLTAKLKALEKGGMVRVKTDQKDKRTRRIHITPKGRSQLTEALPLWTRAQEAMDMLVSELDQAALVRMLAVVSDAE